MNNGFAYTHDFIEVLFQKYLQQKEDINKLTIKANPSLAFPASDIVVTEGEDELFCNFMGTYGVDSSLPGFFNEKCLQNTSTSEALRMFLAVFDKRAYLFFYLAWLHFEPNKYHKYYLKFIRSCSNNYNYTGNYYLIKKGMSKADLSQNLAIIFPDFPITVVDKLPRLQKIETPKLGGGAIFGDNFILGEKILSDSSCINIKIGPINYSQGQFFCEYSNQRKVNKTIASIIEPTLFYKLKIVVTLDKETFILGQSHLGKSSNIGIGTVRLCSN